MKRQMRRPYLWDDWEIDDLPIPIPHRLFDSWTDAITAALTVGVISPAEAAQFVSAIHADYQDRIVDMTLIRRRITRLQVR